MPVSMSKVNFLDRVELSAPRQTADSRRAWFVASMTMTKPAKPHTSQPMDSCARSNRTGPQKSPKCRSARNHVSWRWSKRPDLLAPPGVPNSTGAWCHGQDHGKTQRRRLRDHGLTRIVSDPAMPTENEVTLPVGPDRAFRLFAVKLARDIATQSQEKGRGKCRTRRNLTQTLNFTKNSFQTIS